VRKERKREREREKNDFHYIAQAGLKLLLVPECWDYRHEHHTWQGILTPQKQKTKTQTLYIYSNSKFPAFCK
jgi:hypothetical protein